MENESNSFSQLLSKACSEVVHGECSSSGAIGYDPVNISQLRNLAYNFNEVLKDKKSYVESRTDKETVLLTIIDHPKECRYPTFKCLNKKFRTDLDIDVVSNQQIDETDGSEKSNDVQLNGYTIDDMIETIDYAHYCLSVSPVYRYAFLTELNSIYFPKIEQSIQKIDINFLHGGSDLDEGAIEKIIIRTKIVR